MSAAPASSSLLNLYLLPAACLAALCALLSGCGSVNSVAVNGTAQLTLSPTAFANFGSVIQGLSSSPQTLTITNSGTVLLNITNIAATGDFSQASSACVGGIAPGGSCQVAVTFSPTTTGARTGDFTLTSNAAGSPLSLVLSGTGTPAIPQLTLSTLSINFGTITTGQSSAPWVITASNTGTAPLQLSALTISGDFTQTASGCSTSLAIGASCRIAVVFSPGVTGTRSGVLTVAGNVPTQTVTLTGTGAALATSTTNSFKVTVQAGTKPIAGATVTLYATGTAGNGSAPTLIAGPLLTSAVGSVTFPANATCPTSSPLYVVARGGTVSGVLNANGNIALMSALASCTAIASGTNLLVDEATTVAGIEALAQFYSVGGNIGSTDSNLTGIANAFATASTLADPVAGTAPGSTLPANVAASPAARINSLANLLNSCVVSASTCSALYSATSTAATNTLDAAYFLAKNPTANVAALYTLSQANTAYTPVLSVAPKDWTVFLNFNGGGLNTPTGIGVDSTGSVWVASYFYAASKFSTTGAILIPGGATQGGLNNSYGLALDTSNNVWIPNEQPFTSVGIGSVTELSPSGAPLSGSGGFQNGGMNYPIATAVDPNGTVWVVEYGTSHVSLISPTGVPLSGSQGYFSSQFAFPVAVAIDANHFGWIVNQSSNSVAKVAPDGSSITGYSCCNLASGIAIDQGDNVWVADYFGDSVSLLTNSGTVVASNYTAGGSIYHPQGIAIDGAGTVWVANYRAPYLTELSGSTSNAPGTSLTPTTGIGADAQLLEPYALSIDASGNLWVSNSATSIVTKFIGLAVPVRTPLSGLPQLP